jgi:hypothetical protein
MPRWDSTRRLSFDAALRRPLETDLQTLRAKGVADHNKEESVRIVRFVSPIGISRQSVVPTGVKRGMLPNSQILESGVWAIRRKAQSNQRKISFISSQNFIDIDFCATI